MMTPRILLIVLCFLLIGVAVALTVECASWHAREARARDFQSLVGGLGFGPALELSRCAASFDPRLCPGCPQEYGPVPAGAVFCPYHGFSILHYAPADHAPSP
jgi:hypothetical protein